jgi:type IV pilus assembly protein PilE
MKLSKGFTLTELMIAVAIVGIITSVAYPSYLNFLTGSRRSVAQADLVAFAAAMERHKAANFSYNGAATAGANTGSPSVFQAYSPASELETNKKYDLAISSVSATGTSYVITATPVTSGPQQGDGVLYYFSDGRKAWDVNGDGALATVEYCWSC